MSDISEYLPRKIRNILGEKTDLPIASTRSTIISKLKALLLKASGIANITNSFGTAEAADSVSTTNTPSSIITDGSYLYVAAWPTDPATLDKIDLETFTLHSTLDLSATFSGLIDCEIVKRFLYIVTYTSPAVIIKINLDSFTLDSSLTLTNNLGNCIKSDGTDLYIGHTQIITKVNIETFTETTTLDTGINAAITNIEIDNTYLYAVHVSIPSSVVRIKLSLFTVDSTLSIAGIAASSFIYGNYLYIGLSLTTSLHKINLNTFTLETTFTIATTYASPKLGTDGTYLIIAGSTTTLEGSITYFDIATVTEFGKYVLPSRNVANSLAIDGTFIYLGLGNDTVFRKYIQPTTQTDSRIISNLNLNVNTANTDIAIIKADTQTIEDSTLKANPTAGSLSRFIASGGTALGTQLPDSKSLYDVVALDRLDNATYGLSAIETLVDDLETRLSAVRAGYLDNLSAGAVALQSSVDDLEGRLTAARATLLDEITALRMAELDAANIPADIDTIKGYTDSLEGAVGAIEGATTLHNKLTTVRAGYLDELAAANIPADIDLIKTYTDNNYSVTGALDFTTEKTVFVIAVDTRYQIISPWIYIGTFTNGATITFKFYRAIIYGGFVYLPSGDTITKIVGTDNPIVEFSDWAHYGYTKITAVSNNAADTAVSVMFGYIKKPLE